MKNLFLLFFAFFVHFFASAQAEFAPIGTKWTYSIFGMTGRGVSTFESIKDTIVENLICKKIQHKSVYQYCQVPFNCNPIVSFSYLLIYQSNDSIFNVYSNKFYFSLRWNAKIGDTMRVNNSSLYTIKSKGDTLINGVNLKYSKWEEQCIAIFNGKKIPHVVYQDIGTETPFGVPALCGGLAQESFASLCAFESKGIKIEFKNECSILSDLRETYFGNEISISPNPVEQILNIYAIKNFNKYTIQSIGGQIIKNKEVLETNNIDVSQLPKGIYFLQLIDNQGFTTIKKFIKI